MNRLASLALLALLALAAPAAAQQAVNPMHPAFAPRGADGKPARRSEDVSADATCGTCHDVKYVAAHTGHGEGRARATCLQCHVDGGTLPVDPKRLAADGTLRREDLRIGKPRPANCAGCHGVIGGPGEPVSLPDALAGGAEAGRTFSLTLGEGAVVSPARMADSFLNLAGKERLAAPWDVHAAKLVDCVACHAARNDPARAAARPSALRYVVSDPRRPSTAEYLHQPDHRLAEPDCRACHAAQASHDFLPYQARHLAVLACQACHVPGPMGPAAELVDGTVATAAGTPAIRFRNVTRAEGEPLNAATITPLRPLLVERIGPDGARRLSPVNLVGRWRWLDRATGAEVPAATVASVYLEGGRHARAILDAFDVDQDGTLSEAELRLDRPQKTALVTARLRAAGVADPVVDGALEVHPLAHAIPGRTLAVRDCAECHSAGGRLSGEYRVAAYLPGGVPPRPPDGGKVDLAGLLAPGPAGSLVFQRAAGASPSGLHVLGQARQSATNTLGFLIFVAVAGGAGLHGLARLVLRRRAGGHAPAPHAGKPEYVFGRYERLWHWTMAGSGVVLILTGLVVHGAGGRWPVGLATAVAWHNGAAVVLIANASLALFYHLATAAIRNFIPAPQGLLRRILEHVEYQSRGIFRGGPHPANQPGHKLNPLQQLTYLALLNVLFPLQIGTGAAIWAIGHWPTLGAAVGGLSVLAPVHNLGAWLFLAFFVLHVYLVTTGRTVGEHLSAMITGWQAADPAPGEPGGTP